MTQSWPSWMTSPNSKQQLCVQHERNGQCMFADNLIIMLGHRSLLRLFLAQILYRNFFILLQPGLLFHVGFWNTMRTNGAGAEMRRFSQAPMEGTLKFCCGEWPSGLSEPRRVSSSVDIKGDNIESTASGHRRPGTGNMQRPGIL